MLRSSLNCGKSSSKLIANKSSNTFTSWQTINPTLSFKKSPISHSPSSPISDSMRLFQLLPPSPTTRWRETNAGRNSWGERSCKAKRVSWTPRWRRMLNSTWNLSKHPSKRSHRKYPAASARKISSRKPSALRGFYPSAISTVGSTRSPTEQRLCSTVVVITCIGTATKRQPKRIGSTTTVSCAKLP